MRLSLPTLMLATALAVGCQHHIPRHNLPPADRLFEPGPGVGGPGPGVMEPAGPMYNSMPYGMPIEAMLPSHDMMSSQQQRSVQVLFAAGNDMAGMQVRWDVAGMGQFGSIPLVVPGRQNFPEGGIYRLKVTNVPGHEGVELYPTLEVGPTTPRTEAYLAHNAVPIQFTNEDFDQVQTGNFVTKVIYLPDPEFQELALAGVETLVSTRLDPGVDPITEADRRGSILAIIRLGNKDVEMPSSNGNGDDGVAAAAYRAQMMGAAPPTMGGVPTMMVAANPQMMMGGPGMMAGPAGMMGPTSIGPTGIIPNYISGVSAPQYGMPITGTPIGLPGPPHIPLGGPAGLKRHVMKNHTPMHMPQPTKQMRIDVRQQPGYSYPRPASHMKIHEQNISPSLGYGPPHGTQQMYVP